jgi:iron uptake system EfeUOB component EfeO/EfeM
VQDDRSLVDALRRALEPPPYEPTPERIAALQRQIRRQRLQRPLRRAAVAAAAALIALMGAALAVQTDRQNDQRSADAVAITNTRAAIDQVRFAIAAGNTVQIEQSANALESQLRHLGPADMAAVDDDASRVLKEAHRVLAPRQTSAPTVPITASTSTSSTTTSSSTSTSTSTSTTTTTSTPTTIPETATTTPAP